MLLALLQSEQLRGHFGPGREAIGGGLWPAVGLPGVGVVRRHCLQRSLAAAPHLPRSQLEPAKVALQGPQAICAPAQHVPEDEGCWCGTWGSQALRGVPVSPAGRWGAGRNTDWVTLVPCSPQGRCPSGSCPRRLSSSQRQRQLVSWAPSSRQSMASGLRSPEPTVGAAGGMDTGSPRARGNTLTQGIWPSCGWSFLLLDIPLSG